MSAALVSIIGPPAVGKTTLAENLAEELPAKLLREDYAGNPFLAASYAGVAEAALPAQLHFLLARVEQLSRLDGAAGGLLVSDYGFCQDDIYARARLYGDDLAVYVRLAGRLEPLVRPPQLVIHLDASEPTLLERIARRGRSFEQAFDAGFLTAMRKAYNDAARQLPCEVIGVDCDTEDLLAGQTRAALVGKVRALL